MIAFNIYIQQQNSDIFINNKLLIEMHFVDVRIEDVCLRKTMQTNMLHQCCGIYTDFAS